MVSNESALGTSPVRGRGRMHVSISPEGAVYAPGTEAFFERIGFSSEELDTRDYLVLKLGFVAIYRRSKERLMVRLRPTAVRQQALDRLLRLLVGLDFAQSEVQYFDDGWKSEIWPKGSKLLGRLVQLCDKISGPDEPAFALKPLAFADLDENDGNPLRPLAQKWRITAGIFDDEIMRFLIKYGLDRRLTVMSSENNTDPLRFQYFGDGFKFFSDPQKSAIIGATIEQLPNKEYGRWLHNRYFNVSQNGIPSLDFVTVRLQYADNSMRRSRYERLLLPWRTRNGMIVVTCSSILFSAENEGVA
jgi:hypothetical protein